MKKKYIVDAIVDRKIARLLLKKDESIILDIKLGQLPKGVSEGDIVEIEMEKGRVVFAEIDKEETKKARQEIKALIDDLKKKGSKELRW